MPILLGIFNIFRKAAKCIFVVFNNWNYYNVVRPRRICNSNAIKIFAFTEPTLKECDIFVYVFQLFILYVVSY